MPIDLEAPLDFDSSWPLIYPQKIVLYQQDDEFYESHPALYNGFYNSKRLPQTLLHVSLAKFSSQLSWTP